MSNVKKVTKALSAKTERRTELKDEDRLSLGLTVVNVALSRGRWTDGGLVKGHYVWYVGESESGKSFAGAQLLAEAANNSSFDEYELVYDDAENGLEIDVAQFYGAKLAGRLEVIRSRYVEDFFFGLYNRLKAGKKVVYVLDSMDVLDTKPDRQKFDKLVKVESKQDDDEKIKGSYGTSKAKLNKDNIKRLVSMIEDTGSVLMVISQVYDAIGSRVPVKTTAGGNALRYFAHEWVWTRIRQKLTEEMGGEQWEKGSVVEVAVRKNRVSGWHGKVLVTFLSNHGFDDTGSCVDFLVQYGTWTTKKNKNGKNTGMVETNGFPILQGRKEAIVQKIEESPRLMSKLRALVKKTFIRVDESVTVKRKKRYA